MRPACGCSFFIFHAGWYGVCEIEFSHMGKNSGNPDLVCKKLTENDCPGSKLTTIRCQICHVCSYSATWREPNDVGELRLSGNHTVTEYEMSGEPYSQKSGWIKHSNERIFQVMTFK